MTKERVAVKGEGHASMESGCWTEAFFITLGGPQAHDPSGRDDKGKGGAAPFSAERRPAGSLLLSP
jgi:hypothetical protein